MYSSYLVKYLIHLFLKRSKPKFLNGLILGSFELTNCEQTLHLISFIVYVYAPTYFCANNISDGS